MKKVYSKPQVFIEEFTVSQSIASGCGVPVKHAQYVCSIKVEDKYDEEFLFNTTTSGSTCTYTPVQSDDDKFCYHIPTDTTRYFSS